MDVKITKIQGPMIDALENRKTEGIDHCAECGGDHDIEEHPGIEGIWLANFDRMLSDVEAAETSFFEWLRDGGVTLDELKRELL